MKIPFLSDGTAGFAIKSGYIPVIEACIIGGVAGGSAVVLGLGVDWLGSLRVTLSAHWPELEVLPIFGLVGGLLAGFCLLVAPEISGSGIPQVRAVLNRLKLSLNFRVALMKLLGGTIALGSGLFMGREGPTVQVGAAMANELSRLVPTTIRHRRQLIAAGAGAGLAAAFNAPIAGVIFVIEELLKEFDPATIGLVIVACFSAALVEHMVHNLSHFHVVKGISVNWLQPLDVGFLILLGVVCGCLGALFNRGILLSLNAYAVIKLSKPLKVALAGLATGVIVAMLPPELRNYAATRVMINMGNVSPDLVPLAFVWFFLLTLIAYGAGTPGGLFAPALGIGSAIGYMVGYAQQHYFGSGSVEIYSMVGMGAFFSAVARTPLTAIVIVFEMASNFALVTPLMISCVIASTIGDLLYKGGLYDLLMVWNGIHLRAPGKENLPGSNLSARDVMHRTFRCLQPETTLKDAIMEADRLNAAYLPVIQDGNFVGVFAPDTQLQQNEDLHETRVSNVMDEYPVSVGPHESIEEILLLFARYKFDWLAVTENDKLLGIIKQEDLIKSVFPTGPKTELEEVLAEPQKIT